MRKLPAAMCEQRNLILDCLRYGPFNTIGKIADAAGVTQSAVYRAYKGEHSLNVNSLAALADACNLTFQMRALPCTA